MAAPAHDCPTWADDVDEHRSPGWVSGASEVARQACSDATKQPPSSTNVLGWHREMFVSVAPLDYYAGSTRQDDADRPCLGQDVGVNGVAGTPFPRVPNEFQGLMRQVGTALVELELRWSAMTAADRAQRVAALVGSAVGRFVQIHPFVNGNGRTSRLLWAVLLARLGIDKQASVVRRPAFPYGQVMWSAMNGDMAPAILMVFYGLSHVGKTLPPPTP